MIVVWTRAYNAEKTIRRAIESVLNQTYHDIKYYVLDNGSTDQTGTIIAEYAYKDTRIVPLRNETNNVGINSLNIIAAEREEDYYCQLDADDEYSKYFLSNCMDFLKEWNLDIVACGSDFISTETEQLLGKRALEKNMVLCDPQHFSDFFSLYHQFMRTEWGKLYKLSVLKARQTEKWFPQGRAFGYGADTLGCLESFSCATRIGILAGTDHKYYLSPKSASYLFDSKRMRSDRILHEATRNFLLNRCGSITPRNEHFLLLIYMNAIKDTLNVVIHAALSSLEKLAAMRDIFTYETTVELKKLPSTASSDYQSIIGTISHWILLQDICRTEKGADIAAEIFVAIHEDLPISQKSLAYIIWELPWISQYLLQGDYNRIMDQLHKWFKKNNADTVPLTELEIAAFFALNKPENEVFALLIDIRKKRPQSAKMLNINAQICTLLAKHPLLRGINANLAAAFSQSIRWVIRGDYQKALDKFISVDNVEIDEDDAEAYILLGQNLSAAAENADAYLYFKKIWISYLLDCSRKEEAGKELDELKQLLPEDADIAALCQRLII